MKKKNFSKKQKKSRNLKRAIEKSHTQQTDVIEGYYEVESIKKIKSFGKYELKFFIKWKGWSENDNTWEPFQNVRSCYFNLSEFYAKSIDNKKITNTDAWKMFIGCLKRENLIDEKGVFKENFKRKYNKKNKEKDNLSGGDGCERKSLNNSDNKNNSDLTSMNLKLEADEDDKESEIQTKMIQKENKEEKKVAVKKKNGEPDTLDKNKLKKGKDGNDSIRKKRKYKKRNLLDYFDKKKNDSSSKITKLKRTYSSTIRNLKKNQIQKQVELSQNQQVNSVFQDIEMKLEEGVEEYNEQRILNVQNRIQGSQLVNNVSNLNFSSDQQISLQTNNFYIFKKFNNIENRNIAHQNYLKKQAEKVQKKTFDEETENQDPNLQISKDKSLNEKYKNKDKLKNNQLKNLTDAFESINNPNAYMSEELLDIEESDKSQDEKYLQNGQIQEREENKDQDHLQEGIDGIYLKQRKFRELQQDYLSSVGQEILESEIEPEISKKRKTIQQYEFSSNQNLLDNKQFNSFQELDTIQDEGILNSKININPKNNIFGSNNYIASDILNNLDQINPLLDNQLKYPKKRINELLSMEGSNQGMNQILQLENLNENQIASDFCIDKITNVNDISQLSIPNYATKNTIQSEEKSSVAENQKYSEYLNKIIKLKNYDWQNGINQNQLSILSQNSEYLNKSSLNRIMPQKNQQSSQQYDEQMKFPYEYKSDKNNEGHQTHYQVQQSISMQNKKNVNGQVNKLNTQSQKANQYISIEDDDEIIENTEQTYQLQREKEDKDKFTKFRFIKKNDSIEIQGSQPYKHKQQYLDELQKKRVRQSNFNDIQGQLCGLSKNLDELNNALQPGLKKQYQKFNKDILQSENILNTLNGKNGLQKQSSENSAINGNNGMVTPFNEQTYKQLVLNQFQEVKDLKSHQIITDPQKTIKQLYVGDLMLKDEPTRIIEIDIHPYLVGQYIFKVCWQPRKKRDQLLSSWVEGDKLKLKYPNIVFEFYESFIRFID